MSVYSKIYSKNECMYYTECLLYKIQMMKTSLVRWAEYFHEILNFEHSQEKIALNGRPKAEISNEQTNK